MKTSPDYIMQLLKMLVRKQSLQSPSEIDAYVYCYHDKNDIENQQLMVGCYAIPLKENPSEDDFIFITHSELDLPQNSMLFDLFLYQIHWVVIEINTRF